LSKDWSLEVRRAFVANLRGAAGVTALVSAGYIFGEFVVADIPADQPFIRMGYSAGDQFEATGWDGSEHDFTVHVFAPGPSTDAVLTIANAVIAAAENMTVGGIDGFSADWVRTITLPDEVAERLHAVVTFSVTAFERVL